MKKLISARTLAAAGLVLGAFGAATAAHARSDVYFSIGFQSPDHYVQHAPVYVQPRPVYVQPQSYYVAPQTYYVQPAPVYSHGWQRRGPYGDRDRDGIANVYDNHNDRRNHGRNFAPRRDADRDGVPNRFDRAPNNPYRY